MEKEELNAKLGYDNELLDQLANAFDLQEDYNDYGWNKLFEICRYIHNLETQLEKQKEIIDKAKNQINKFNKEEGLSMYEDTWNHLKQVLEILEEKEK